MPVSLSNVDLPNEEHVRHREPNTWAYLSYNSSQTSTSISKLLGRGTLVIGEERLIWRIENGQGFVLHYPQISLHAISRDLSNFHAECLFLLFEDQNNLFQIDPTEIEPPSSLSELNTENVDDDDCDNEEAISKEIRFVPDDSSHLEAIYRSMCECQLMHPDQEDQDSDEDNDYMDEFDEGGDQDDDKHNGDEQMEEGQFDDAA